MQTKKEIIELLEKAHARKLKAIAEMMESDQKDNPQIVKMRTKVTGEAEAFYAVIRALKYGDAVELRIYAGL